MWPTMFMPLCLIETDFRDGDIDHLCGIATPVSGTVTVPTPSTIETGMIQLVIASYWTNTTPTWPGFANGWREAFDAETIPVSSEPFGDGTQKIFWRIFTAGDPAFAATIPSGNLEICYVSMILRNTNLNDPILNAWMMHRPSSPYGPHPALPANYIEVAKEGDVIIQFTSPDRTLGDSTVPDAGSVEFSCKHATAASPGTGHIVSALYGKRGNVSNLLRQSKTLATSAWTYVGMTRESNPIEGIGNVAKANVRLRQATGTTKHYIEQEVALEAGKTYLLGACGFGNRAGTRKTTVWLSYVKPDSSEHGCGGEVGTASSGDRANISGATAGRWDDTPGPSVFNFTGDPFTGEFGHTFTLPIVCDTTGTYKIRLHLTDGITLDPGSTSAGNTGVWWVSSDMVLQEQANGALYPHASFYPTAADAVAVGDVPYTLLAPPDLLDNASNSARGFGGIVVRRGSPAKRPLCKLFNPASRGIRLDVSDYKIEDTRIRNGLDIQTGASGPAYEGATSSHCVSEYLSHKKYYFEVKVTSIGTAGTHAAYAIGFCPFYANHLTPDFLADPPGDYTTQYAYNSTGQVYRNGTLEAGTVDAWVSGDIIGAAIDFTNWEISFYRNGTLQDTVSIANNSRRYALWNCICSWLHEDTAAAQARFTWNFRGPFGGRKPSGFVAFDFDNELT